MFLKERLDWDFLNLQLRKIAKLGVQLLQWFTYRIPCFVDFLGLLLFWLRLSSFLFFGILLMFSTFVYLCSYLKILVLTFLRQSTTHTNIFSICVFVFVFSFWHCLVSCVCFFISFLINFHSAFAPPPTICSATVLSGKIG